MKKKSCRLNLARINKNAAKNNLKSYALLGSGRVAQHFGFYLKSLKLPVLRWSRAADPNFNSERDADAQERLRKVVRQSSHILFAVKDGAIAELSGPLHDSGKMLVHFSGALHIEHVHAAHPLMTFGPQLNKPAWYRQIPFVLDDDAELADLLPGLPNPSWKMAPQQRSLYHALCSLAGNSAYLLWSRVGDEFEKSLGLPRGLLLPLLRQVVANTSPARSENFTGPVARGDWEIVQRHLNVLNSRPELLKAYRSYLEFANALGHLVPEALL